MHLTWRWIGFLAIVLAEGWSTAQVSTIVSAAAGGVLPAKRLLGSGAGWNHFQASRGGRVVVMQEHNNSFTMSQSEKLKLVRAMDRVLDSDLIGKRTILAVYMLIPFGQVPSKEKRQHRSPTQRCVKIHWRL